MMNKIATIIFGFALVASSIQAKPVEFTPAERTERYFLFSGFSYAACDAVNKARASRGLGEVVESKALAMAGSYLIDHMLREDWIGTSFPSGYTLRNALAQAGYPTNANVQVVVRVASNNNGLFGDGNVAKVLSAADGYNNGMVAFGYFTIWPKLDGGRVNTNQVIGSGTYGGYYEVMLFGSVLPPVAERPLVDMSAMTEKYSFSDARPINLTAKKGQRVKKAIVESPRYIVGKAKVKGKLPPGLKFSAKQGRFVGKPKKKGNYRVVVTANYRKRANANATGVDGGQVSTVYIIRVR